ncbi:MAG TPA: phosphoribosylformylglycinamidine synthase subunit PurQ [Victivallales bacterium]|nr:phosphoribosylformylglycinamidine synthase subunit PurQ [Victivallales bacterium]HPO90935.1 phosphoribosylformylglycinamidine synthase subunit PurQ [Victivallales bacterium]
MPGKKIKKKVNVLIMTGYGLNCEEETGIAFEYCGAKSEKLHLNDILEKENILERFHIFAFIGGFSFGDHLGAGTVLANRLKFRIQKQIIKFINEGKLIIGICNGFQTMTRLGLLPALGKKYFEQQAALIHNDSGLFRDDWVFMKGNQNSPCVFTKDIVSIKMPVRHGEGKFVAEPAIISEIMQKNLYCLQYCDEALDTNAAFPYNPNGSINNIAGICDETGRIFGLMPHPEAFLSPYNEPDWIRKKLSGIIKKEGDGIKIFANAVNYAKENLF